MEKSVKKTWTDFPLTDTILQSLNEHGYKSPLLIQSRTLKASLIENKHVLGAARTGSGKTLAYALPVVNRILTSSSTSTQLKKMLCKAQVKNEDFELIDDEVFAVEDMIIEKDNQKFDSDSDQSTINTDLEEDKDELCDESRLCPDAIILVPTRELAVQVKQEIDKICKLSEISTLCIIGGMSQEKQIRKLSRLRPQIVIGTPGRLYELAQSGVVEYLNMQSIASIQSLVIDEADRMVQKGHFDEMLKIVDAVKESKIYRRDEFPYRVYLFSATLTFLHELPDRLKPNPLIAKNKTTKKKERKHIDPKDHTKKNKIRKMLTLFGIDRSDTRIIDLNDESTYGRPSSKQLSEYRINCISSEKDLYLYYFLRQHPNSRTLVFCNSKDCLRRLTNVLKYLGHTALNLHSEMDQKKRLTSLEKFRSQPNALLIATDIAARGLDIVDLEHVIHYQVPKTCESYIHRSGRTARVNRKGTSLTLCEPQEVPAYRRLCNNINGGKDLELFEVDLDLKALLKEHVVLAQQCDKLDHKLREKKSNQNWFMKAAKECDIELDEEDIRQLSGKGKTRQQNLEEEASDRRRLAKLQKHLGVLMRRPLITKGSLIRDSMSKVKIDNAQ